MATPRIPNQRKQYNKLNERLARYVLAVQSIYDDLNKQAAKIGLQSGYDGEGEFRWADFPELRSKVDKLQTDFVTDIGALIMRGTSEEWKNSNLLQDMIADKVIKAYTGEKNRKQFTHYYQTNSPQLRAFQQRKDRGMNLSTKLWNQSEEYKRTLEDVLAVSIERGTDAITLSKRISKYLSDFDTFKNDYTEKFGKATKVHDCEYRSIRLARSEINMAYRTAEQERWKQFDFVVGYEIKLSGSHPKEDICDSLAGKYPKNFVWTGWHPNCYTEEAMVLTAKGWKHFVDVEYDDMILSLNPNTRDVEWTSIVAKQCYLYNGEVVRFFNKSLECMVTPEHQMVFLNKNDGRIRKAEAREYRKGLGAFYRTCVHADKEERATIDINGEVWSFDDYCEFIGYWLADGSVAHASTVNLAQKEGEPARQCMIECIKRLGYEPHAKKDSIEFFRSPIVRYLRQFGKSYQKYIPQEILQASKRQIGIFLNAFIKCDGYSRKTKSFVGNHGCEFHSDKEERLFFTTSQQMAGQLCQLLLLIGHRPSFSIKEPSTHITKEGRVIKANYPCYVISECYSGTATVFDKEFIHYEGNVYDLTLAKNHIMYVCFNGRCFWGSNCMDYCIPILKTDDEFFAIDDEKPSVNEVTDVPPQFKEWCTENWGRIAKAEKNKTLPYFLSDNKEYYQKLLPQPIKIREEYKDLYETLKKNISDLEVSPWGVSNEDERKNVLEILESVFSDVDNQIYVDNILKGVAPDFLSQKNILEEFEYDPEDAYQRLYSIIRGAKVKPKSKWGEFKNYRELPNDFTKIRDFLNTRQTEKNMLSRYGMDDFEEFFDLFGGREKLRNELQGLAENSSVYMSIDANNLELVLKDGEFKNSLQTGEGTFTIISEKRKFKECKMFGLDPDTAPQTMPKYGFIASKQKMNYEEIVGFGYGENAEKYSSELTYGETFVRFKDQVKRKTTVTFGDSYDGHSFLENAEGKIYGCSAAAPCVPIEHMDERFMVGSLNHQGTIERLKQNVVESFSDAHSLNDVFKYDIRQHTYVEAQVYGKLEANQIDTIYVASIRKKAELEKVCEELGYNFNIEPAPYDSRLKKLLEKESDYVFGLKSKEIGMLGERYHDAILESWGGGRNLSENIKGRMPSDIAEYQRKYLNGQLDDKGKVKLLEWLYDDYETHRKEYRTKVNKRYNGWVNDVLNKDLLK